MNNQEQEIIIQSESKEIRIRKILAIRDSLANTITEITTYGWDNNFKWKVLRECQEKIHEGFGRVDFSDFSSDELKLCGFKKWDAETNIHLVPFWLYPYMAYGIELTCISGEKVKVTPLYIQSDAHGAYIDNDHRAGCIAYGVIPTE